MRKNILKCKTCYRGDHEMKTFTLGSALRKIALLLAIGLAPISAHCGTMTGTIATITYTILTPNFVFIYLSNPSTGAPACATRTTRMTLDLTTQSGKAMYAHLLALKLTNPTATITLLGSNNCSAWGDTENIAQTFL